jgi:hypothetical protein
VPSHPRVKRLMKNEFTNLFKAPHAFKTLPAIHWMQPHILEDTSFKPLYKSLNLHNAKCQHLQGTVVIHTCEVGVSVVDDASTSERNTGVGDGVISANSSYVLLGSTITSLLSR